MWLFEFAGGGVGVGMGERRANDASEHGGRDGKADDEPVTELARPTTRLVLVHGVSFRVGVPRCGVPCNEG